MIGPAANGRGDESRRRRRCFKECILPYAAALGTGKENWEGCWCAGEFVYDQTPKPSRYILPRRIAIQQEKHALRELARNGSEGRILTLWIGQQLQVVDSPEGAVPRW